MTPIGSTSSNIRRAIDFMVDPPDADRLAEVLDECRGLLVNIEIKNWPDDPDFDPTEPGPRQLRGSLHPITIVQNWTAGLKP